MGMTETDADRDGEGLTAGHTPGEWYVQEPQDEAFDEGWFVMAPKPFPGSRYLTNEPVAECCGDGNRQEADAHLIAAAPDLLAACKAALADETQSRNNGGYITDGTVAQLRAAIAKATVR